MKTILSAILCIATTILIAQEDKEQQWTGNRPDGHAPISVMGDHTHGKGEFMFSYRFMHMNMEDLNFNSDNASFQDALDRYMVTPTSMPMQMHMIGVMYAPSNRVTLMVMGNYITSDMDHLTRMGGTFTTKSSGFGDLKVGALYKLFNKNRQQIHANVGVSIPTGSIDETDVTPASSPNEVILPYPMQIGSGTFDAEIGLTYLKQWQNLSFGAQGKALFRIGENDNNYSLGNKYTITTWSAYKVSNWLSFSGRMELGAIEEIDGVNPVLNPMMVITADTNNSGMTYGNAGLGFNLYADKGYLKNFRLGFEASLPLFQNMNGIQLRQKETITVGLQYAFH
ncbi:transporter [Winogradskyella sp. 3972H.M.0a.05]|uniref:transporter n=1 Tax=Winogradskyella sp. 3972H.M.0a.05 TaxID=2950277 RepID=UPI00339A567E